MNNIELNDLFDYGLYIYQYKDKFKFSIDSVLLAEFIDIKKDTKHIVDFCTGNAPIPQILSTKTKSKITGIEIQKDIYNLALDSISYNKLDNQIKIINTNIKNVKDYFSTESVDIVSCNPPYFKYDETSLINETKEKAIARHEIEMNLEDIMINAKYILKNKGELYLVHRCDRLEEIFKYLDKYNFSIKKLQFIYSNLNKKAIMVLIKAIKNGNKGSLKVNKPISIENLITYKEIFKEGD